MAVHPRSTKLLRRALALAASAGLFLLACEGCGPPDPPPPEWAVSMEGLAGAIPSIWGTSNDDIYAVGGGGVTNGTPLVLHYDGAEWTTLDSGLPGTVVLWWVFGFEGGPVYMVGTAGTVVRHDPATGTFTPETTPGTQTLFGVWGAAPNDLWTVGGNVAGAPPQQVLWHSDGSGTWTDESASLPSPEADTTALFKIWGSAADDIWAVGALGVAVHWDGAAWTWYDSGTDRTLFTVHTDGARAVAVGGFGNGLWTEWDGTAWTATTPTAGPQFNGVWLSGDRDWIVGAQGAIWTRPGGAAAVGTPFEDHGEPPLTGEDYHAVWVAPEGDVWAVGGALLAPAFDEGIIVHRAP